MTVDPKRVAEMREIIKAMDPPLITDQGIGVAFDMMAGSPPESPIVLEPHMATRDQDFPLDLAILRRLNQIYEIVKDLAGQETRIMAAIDDLKANILAEQTVIAQLGTDIAAAIAIIQNPASNAADIQAAADSIKAMTATLQASAANLEAAVNPAPTPA